MSGQHITKNEFLGDGPGQIPMAGIQWDTLVDLGELPRPDHRGFYPVAVIEAVKEKIGPIAMSGWGETSAWCQNAVGRHCRSQADIFSDTLAKLGEARRRDEEAARAI